MHLKGMLDGPVDCDTVTLRIHSSVSFDTQGLAILFELIREFHGVGPTLQSPVCGANTATTLV